MTKRTETEQLVESLPDGLPNRPVAPATGHELAERLEVSLTNLIYSTPNGTEFVPEMLMWVPTSEDEEPTGTAYRVAMDDQMTEWHVEREQTEIKQGTWTEATDRYSRMLGAKGGPDGVALFETNAETGETALSRDLRD